MNTSYPHKRHHHTSTDLLHGFLPTSPNTTLRRHNSLHSPEEEEDGEVLNLGLSLDGRFGVDKSHKGLVRSSSVAAAMPVLREVEAAPATVLVRTASLPPEMEEEWRKRKEIQSLRRLEAKRKRSEKQRSGKGNGSNPDLVKANPGYGYRVQGLHMQRHKREGSQGSAESQEASKSSASESERNTNQGSSSGTRNSEVSSENQIEVSEDKKKAREGENGIGGDMPCVFTVGDGPGGRKVEGILYRYKKGEEVRIMCVCHGSFFTPAEFVNHSGARNVAHPLKRIVVNPNPSPFS